METVELAALVAGLTEMVKVWVPAKLTNKVCPLIAVLIGLLGNVYMNSYSVTPDVIVGGLAVGLVTAGLYKGGKNFSTRKPKK